RLAHDYGEQVAPIVELIAGERAAVQPAIVDSADQCRHADRFVRKISKLLEGIESPEARDDSQQSPAKFAGWAAAQLRTLADTFLAAMPGDSSDVVALHQFRIRAKALRYAIEIVASAFEPELRTDLYPVVGQLQERLGRVQDHV